MEGNNKDGKRDLTARQFLALKYWREDKFRNKARALRKAGYSEAIARQPHKFFNSPIIKEELYFLGLGDRVSRYQREQKVPIKEWRQGQKKQEDEKKRVDEAIRSITPEQISVLRKRLIEIGYNPNFNVDQHPPADVCSRPQSQDRGDIFEIQPAKSITTSMPSFSSM